MEIAQQRLMSVVDRHPIIMHKGKGSWLEDTHGIKYLDFIQGRASNSLGHSPDEVITAVIEQAGRLINPSPLFFSVPSLKLAQYLTDHSCFDEVFFANSGTEAVECAIKMARKWGGVRRLGASGIITFHNCFHGRTFGSMAATGRAACRANFGPMVPGFIQATLNNIQSVIECIDGDTVAILVELIQGESGVIQANPDFVRDLRRLCVERNMLLIFDEVQTGIGRLGTFLGYQYYGVEPDIAILGKGLGGGMPIAAVLAKKHANALQPGDHGGTFNGAPMVTAASLAVVGKILSPGFLDRARDMGHYFHDALTNLSKELALGCVGGVGLLLRLETNEGLDSTHISNYARDHLRRHRGWEGKGLLINAPRKNVLRFMPALNIEKCDVDKLMDGLRITIEHVLTVHEKPQLQFFA